MAIKMLRPDSKGRITLGEWTKGISGFSVHQERNGNIILEPFVEIPVHEKWLYDNKNAFKKVKTGLEQARNSKLIDKGSFSQFADDEIE
jgi:hypothetical protein